eukprot:2600853-Lingulodinium_polyedra.AAC.1
MVTLRHNSSPQSGMVRFGWADSSPQSGRNWFMLMHTLLKADLAPTVVRAADTLTRSRDDLQDHQESEVVSMSDTLQLNSTLAHLRDHKGVPVALGSGKASTEDKISAML